MILNIQQRKEMYKMNDSLNIYKEKTIESAINTIVKK